MLTVKQSNVPDVCSDKVSNFEAQQDNWVTVGSTRRWDYVIGGKSEYMVERIEAIDEKKKMMHRRLIEGSFSKHYKSMECKTQVIPKGHSSCIVSVSFDYEKLNEDAPEPHEMMEFSLGLFKDIASHIVSAN